MKQIASSKLPKVNFEFNLQKTVTPLADESMVFDTDRKPVGLIFETFGTVKKPFYSIRFNTFDEIEDINVKVGNEIQFGEGFSEFVNVKYLLAQKGSDASWEHDVEVDEHHKVKCHSFRFGELPALIFRPKLKISGIFGR